MQPRATGQGHSFHTIDQPRRVLLGGRARAVRKEAVMAKRKGNKEARKPKQQKEKKTEVGSVSELMARAAMPGKRR